MAPTPAVTWELRSVPVPPSPALQDAPKVTPGEESEIEARSYFPLFKQLFLTNKPPSFILVPKKLRALPVAVATCCLCREAMGTLGKISLVVLDLLSMILGA